MNNIHPSTKTVIFNAMWRDFESNKMYYNVNDGAAASLVLMEAAVDIDHMVLAEIVRAHVKETFPMEYKGYLNYKKLEWSDVK